MTYFYLLLKKEYLTNIIKVSIVLSIIHKGLLTSYCRLKHEFILQPYLDNIHEKRFKIASSRFRLSSHDLEIERGCYSNISREARICKFCSLNVVENEYQFLLICPMYLRRKNIKPYYCRWPTLNIFDQIMTSKNKNVMLNLSKYIYFSNKLRNKLDE